MRLRGVKEMIENRTVFWSAEQFCLLASYFL